MIDLPIAHVMKEEIKGKRDAGIPQRNYSQTTTILCKGYINLLYYIIFECFDYLLINLVSFFDVLNFVVTQIQVRYSSRYLVMLT